MIYILISIAAVVIMIYILKKVNSDEKTKKMIITPASQDDTLIKEEKNEYYMDNVPTELKEKLLKGEASSITKTVHYKNGEKISETIEKK